MPIGRCGLPGAVVLAQPVAAADALDRDTMEAALAVALAEADARGILGKAVTPFLLDRIRSATAGRSLHANLALIAANARLAAEVAVELDGLRARGNDRESGEDLTVAAVVRSGTS